MEAGGGFGLQKHPLVVKHVEQGAGRFGPFADGTPKKVGAFKLSVCCTFDIGEVG